MDFEDDPLLHRAQHWASLGTRCFSDGTVLIGPMPARGSEAYFHRIYGPLSQLEVERVEQEVQSNIPEQVVDFYLHHNGCSIFSGQLKVFGLRKAPGRADTDAIACSPIDIIRNTLHARAQDPGIIFQIGAYIDGSRVMIGHDGSVFRVPQLTFDKILNRWIGFMDWLLTEFDRMAPLFDSDGNEIARSDRITPSIY